MTRRLGVRFSPLLGLAIVAGLLAGAAAGASSPRARPAMRAKYVNESATRALTIVRHVFPGELAGGFRSFDASHGTLVRELSQHQAIVENSTGRQSLAIGVLPLFGRTAAGRNAAVDLGLVRQRGQFVPRSALVRVSLPNTSRGALTFAKPHFDVRLAGGSRVAGQQAGGGVFFANVGGRARDTDAVIRPIPAGAEMSFVLRAPASAQSQRLSFGLPSGWRLAGSRVIRGAVQILSARGALVALVAPVVAKDAHGRTVPAGYRVQGKRRLLITAEHRRGGFAYPILLNIPVTDSSVGSWAGSQPAWHAVTSAGKPSLGHRFYSGYGVWYGTGPRRYTAGSWGVYRAAASAGAYIYALVESGVMHTQRISQEFGGIAKAGNAGWETTGAWSGPDGKGAGAFHANSDSLSEATYAYCARPGCAPNSAVDTGNAAAFGLRMLGPIKTSTSSAALIDDATLYEADRGPVVLTGLRHRGYVPGTWVSNATDTVTATAAEASGLGIDREDLSGTGMRPGPSVSARCAGNGRSTCPLGYTGSLTYNTAALPDGQHSISEQAMSAGGVLSPAPSWTVNIDRKRPTIALSGPLARKNNARLAAGQYGLNISARDVNGSTPTSGVAQITVRVDGAVQSRVSGFAPCAFGSKCRPSAAASWTLNTANYASGAHTVAIQAADSARNTTTSSIRVTIPKTPPAPSKVYWGAHLGTQFGGSPPWDLSTETQFANEDSGGKRPTVVDWGESFYSSSYCGGYCPFQTSLFDSVRKAGYIPLLSWGSTNDANYYDAKYTDAAVANGSQDAYIKQWATAAKNWGHPLFLRFDWEMNGPWWNFGTGKRSTDGTPPNQPADFVAMWRHVHSIFTQVGASNVTWVWCPNWNYSNQLLAPFASVYPGDSYVDWTCLDAYNADAPWTSFHNLFTPSYDDVTSIAPSKPMIIGETSSTAMGGSKPQWISDMFSDLPVSFPKIRGFLWFDLDGPGPAGRTDWPIEGPDPKKPDSASIAAFRAGISSSRYTSNNYQNLNTAPIPPPG